MKKIIATILGVLALASASQAQAAASRCPDYYVNPNTTITVSSWTFNVTEGATESVNLCRSLRVHKLYIQAEGYYHDAYAQVIVNGNVKGTLYVPGRDPSYVVTVEEETSSIQIQNLRGGTFKIRNITAVVSESGDGMGAGPNPGPCRGNSCSQFPNYAHTQMGQISSRVIWLVNSLEGYTNYRTYGEYLLPIRKAAAEALAIAEARGDTSLSARTYYEKLLNTLDAAAPYIDNAFEVDYAFNLATELMSKREYIRRILQ